MRTIWKYDLEPIVTQSLEGIKLLSVEIQHDVMVAYVVSNPDADKDIKEIQIKIVLTGHDLPCDIDEYTFLSTQMLNQGNLVAHVFYRYIEEE